MSHKNFRGKIAPAPTKYFMVNSMWQ